ncbi:MAG: hypothetical protein RLZZ618_3026 [Pseudomonadota bacterium]
MRTAILRSWAPFCLLALACFGMNKAAAQSTVEFSELVKSLMIPAGPTHQLPGWDLPMHPAIRWKDASPRPAGKSSDRDALPMVREGTVFVTVNGQPSYVPIKPGTPASLWHVTLRGSRQGRLEAELAQGEYGEGTSLPIALLKPAKFQVRSLCKPQGISSGMEVFAVATQGVHPVVLGHEWSSGSAGTMAWLRFAFTTQRAAKLKCE